MKLTALDHTPPSKASEESPTRVHPFDDTRDPAFFFPASAHEALLSRLHQRLSQLSQSISVACGDPGSGKTYLRSALFNELDPARFARVAVENSLLDFDQLLLEILSQLSGRRALARSLPDRYARISEFKRLLSQRVVQTDRRLVLLLDEGQAYAPGVLDQLRQLTNTNMSRQGIISCVFFGSHDLQPELESSPELDWRVGNLLDVGRFDAGETRAYVLHRLAVAGHSLQIRWSDDEWRRLHDVSGGLPGPINRIMRECIENAAVRDSALDGDALLSALSSATAVRGNPGLFA